MSWLPKKRVYMLGVVVAIGACKASVSAVDARSASSENDFTQVENTEEISSDSPGASLTQLNLTPPAPSSMDFRCTTLNSSAADNSAQLQACINATSDGGKVWLPAATFILKEKVTLSRGVSLFGINGVATLQPVRHDATLRFPDLPNLSTLSDVRVDFSLAKTTMVNVLDYFAPKVPLLTQRPPRKMTTIVGQNYLYLVKDTQPNKFVLYDWDTKYIYLKIDQSQRPQGYSLAWGVWLPRYAKIGTTFSTKTDITWYAADSCNRLATSPYTYAKTLKAHSVSFFGGDVGWQDSISFAYRHSGSPNSSCPGAVDEVFDFSSQWGNIQWRMICVKTGAVVSDHNRPQIAPGFWLDTTNSAGLATYPNKQLLCTGGP